jgi:peptide/nickel transport system substrate-binding protein
MGSDAESQSGYDPTLGWGERGSPLFQSTLLRRDADLNIVNDLAESYSISPDKLKWNVKIRKDVKFSDGTPLTAQDVVFTYKQALKAGGTADLTVMSDVTAPSDNEVIFTLKKPYSVFINRLISLGVVPQKTYDAKTYARNPVGSGPYKFVRWDEGQQLVVEANPLYYGPQPAIKRVVFLFSSEENAFAQAKAGKVQIASVAQNLATQPIENMKVVVVKSVDNRGLLFPTQPEQGLKTPKGYPIGNNVTADSAIRQAINYVLDRQTLVKGVLEGFGSPAFGPVTSLAWEQPSSLIQDNQPALAKKILAEGGWKPGSDGILTKNGLRASFTIIFPSGDSTRQALALAAADQIKPLGIEVKTDGKGWDDIQKLMQSNVIVFGWGSHDQTEMYNIYHSRTPDDGYYNPGNYANTQVDNYLDLAMGAGSEAEANTFWKAAQLDDKNVGFTTKGDAVWAWLVNLNHTYYVSNCLDIGKPQVEPHGHGWALTAGIASWKWTCPGK